MADFLLVDGYNVVGAWPELVALKEKSLEHAREKLADILAGYGAYKDYKVVIVFDANKVASGGPRTETTAGGLEIVYSQEGETADSYIERQAYQLVRAGHNVYVVTSDWAQQLTVLGAGAWRIPARELLADVLAAAKAIRDGYVEADWQRRRQEVGGRLAPDIARRLDALRRGR